MCSEFLSTPNIVFLKFKIALTLSNKLKLLEHFYTQKMIINPNCLLLCVLEIIEKLRKPPPLFRPVVSPDYAPFECIQLMKQCWNEQPDKRLCFEEIFDQVDYTFLTTFRFNLNKKYPRLNATKC